MALHRFLLLRSLHPKIIGPISVAAYSYMSLVPIIQPPVIRALTTREERLIRMPYRDKKISKKVLIAFNYHNSGVGHCRTDKCSLIGR